MNDCRSECQSFCDMKASLERKFSTHWAEEEQREIMMRGQYLEKLLRLNASGVLTDEDYEFFERRTPVDRSAELFYADQRLINAMGGYAMNCPGMQYRVTPVLGTIMGSEKVCPNEALWAQHTRSSNE